MKKWRRSDSQNHTRIFSFLREMQIMLYFCLSEAKLGLENGLIGPYRGEGR